MINKIEFVKHKMAAYQNDNFLLEINDWYICIFDVANETGIIINPVWSDIDTDTAAGYILDAFDNDILHVADFLTTMFSELSELYPSEHNYDRVNEQRFRSDIRYICQKVKCTRAEDKECYHYYCTATNGHLDDFDPDTNCWYMLNYRQFCPHLNKDSLQKVIDAYNNR